MIRVSREARRQCREAGQRDGRWSSEAWDVIDGQLGGVFGGVEKGAPGKADGVVDAECAGDDEPVRWDEVRTANTAASVTARTSKG